MTQGYDADPLLQAVTFWRKWASTPCWVVRTGTRWKRNKNENRSKNNKKKCKREETNKSKSKNLSTEPTIVRKNVQNVSATC
jgi:hypothetical protein